MNENEKDIEIALLRQQLRIVERRQERGPRLSLAEGTISCPGQSIKGIEPTSEGETGSKHPPLAKENPGLGYDKLEGELAKLGFSVSPNTVKNVMIRNGIPPAPERDKLGTSWRAFLAHYKD